MTKSKVRLPAIGALAAKLGSLALIVASDPAVLSHAAGKLGISAAVLTSIVQAVTKPVVRSDSERHTPRR